MRRMTLVYGTVFFFNATTTTEIYALSLHDALPISVAGGAAVVGAAARAGLRRPAADRPHLAQLRPAGAPRDRVAPPRADRKSTRLNSSHANTSYAVFCLKKKKNLSEPPVLPYPSHP